MVATLNLLQNAFRIQRDRTDGHESQPVPVWDARLARYRDVPLNDRTDPLWPAATALAALRQRMTIAV